MVQWEQWWHCKLIQFVCQWAARLYSSPGSWDGIRNKQDQWFGVNCAVNRADYHLQKCLWYISTIKMYFSMFLINSEIYSISHFSSNTQNGGPYSLNRLKSLSKTSSIYVIKRRCELALVFNWNSSDLSIILANIHHFSLSHNWVYPLCHKWLTHHSISLITAVI